MNQNYLCKEETERDLTKKEKRAKWPWKLDATSLTSERRKGAKSQSMLAQVRNSFLLCSLQGVWPCWHLNYSPVKLTSHFWSPELEENTCVALSHQVCGNYYSSPREQIQRKIAGLLLAMLLLEWLPGIFPLLTVSVHPAAWKHERTEPEFCQDLNVSRSQSSNRSMGVV